MKLLGLRRTVICPIRLIGDDGITKVMVETPAIVEPKRPVKAALREPEEIAEVAVEVQLEVVMIGSEIGVVGRSEERRRRSRVGSGGGD
jgi:hypothetical protein